MAIFAQAAAGADTSNAASTIGWVIAILLIAGFFVAIAINVRRGRHEVGAELELAPNRKPYLSDEELEGKKLDRTLGAGLVLLAMISIIVPLYWLYEPARQAGAVENFKEEAIASGLDIYTTKAKCADCHGPQGVGGVKSTSLTNANGDFVATINYQAPALNTVLFRYTTDEVKFILNYGRPYSPMPAWGAPGGGPLTDQQLDNVIAYLDSIQLSAADATAALNKEIDLVCKPARNSAGNFTSANPPCDPSVNDKASPNGATHYATLGEALFNLGLYDAFQAGAYSCGRCHTKGWSYGQPQVPGGGGTMGPNLTGGSELRQFDTTQNQVDFITRGSELGKKYGNNGLGNGLMPGFGVNRNAEVAGSDLSTNQIMYTQEQITAIAEYERSL
jgi:mono/diheme cytochrome c family protein